MFWIVSLVAIVWLVMAYKGMPPMWPPGHSGVMEADSDHT